MPLELLCEVLSEVKTLIHLCHRLTTEDRNWDSTAFHASYVDKASKRKLATERTLEVLLQVQS